MKQYLGIIYDDIKTSWTNADGTELDPEIQTAFLSGNDVIENCAVMVIGDDITIEAGNCNENFNFICNPRLPSPIPLDEYQIGLCKNAFFS